MALFFIRLPPPGQRSFVTSTDAATTRRPFEWLRHSPRGLARACVWRQFFAANGQPVVAGLVLCRRQIPSRGRIQKVPFRFPARSGSLREGVFPWLRPSFITDKRFAPRHQPSCASNCLFLIFRVDPEAPPVAFLPANLCETGTISSGFDRCQSLKIHPEA